MSKSNTDRHWNERALNENDDARVNIADTVQRDLELDFIFSQLPAEARVLEIGCGNGYGTRQLRDVGEQAAALGNMARWLKPGGKLFLMEGFADGFDALNGLRRECDLPDLVPAAINFYSSVAQLMPFIERSFTVADQFHTGMFD